MCQTQQCEHLKVMPEFDVEIAKTLTTKEIRLRYPRFSGKCPDCDFDGIIYASFEQYIYGDY